MATENTNLINLVGNVTDPTQAQQPDGNYPPMSAGRQGDQLTSELHGKHYTACYRNKLFEANAVNVTVPVNAAALVSVFTLYNPPNSNVLAEMVDTSVMQWMATTVVDVAGWYFSNQVLTSKATFNTVGTVQSGKVGANPNNLVQMWTNFTHSGTPVLIDFIGSFGATTNTTAGGIQKFYDGRLILPPGMAMSLAMTTGAGTTTGLSLEARWVEWPL
jgi:hypothetical protein